MCSGTVLFSALLITGVVVPRKILADVCTDLYEQMVSDYDPTVPPIKDHNGIIDVYIGLKLLQILDIDEKNEQMTTNIWLRQEWKDEYLQWNPEEFDNVSSIYLPIDQIWKPEIVLYNNADGKYQVSRMVRATIHHTGDVVWEPPAIFISYCSMNVEFFPFDEQRCPMKFGSWTYDINQVDVFPLQDKGIRKDIRPNAIANAINLDELDWSVAWDIVATPGERHVDHYPCCPSQYADMTFYITLRRRSLFYTVNLIIPCVGISFLAVLTFYLPSDSGEKISLSITIMLSLSVFILLLSEMIPSTSIVVPVVGKYLFFTVILVTVAIVVTVVVLNVHFRSPLTSEMKPWMRIAFIRVLPNLLLMRKPLQLDVTPTRISLDRTSNLKFKNMYYNKILQCSSGYRPTVMFRKLADTAKELACIAYQLKNENDIRKVKEDWKFIALVLDRLFLWIFTTASVIGTLGIICQAPNIYETLHSNITSSK